MFEGQKNIDDISLSSCCVNLYYNDIFISHATGFVYEAHAKQYVITNWHVMSGRNTYTGQPISKNGAIPNIIEICLSFLNVEEGTLLKKNCHAQIEFQDKVNWIQHEKGQLIDIAAIELKFENDRFGKPFAINNILNTNDSMALDVGADIFIVGYPLQRQPQNGFPIWKRGTVSSEPDFEVDGYEMILVDAHTRSGMSGSPVFYTPQSYRLRPGKQYEIGDQKGMHISNNAVQNPGRKFIGVYSGRYNNSHNNENLELNIGRVWSRKYIDQMLSNPQVGSYKIIRP